MKASRNTFVEISRLVRELEPEIGKKHATKLAKGLAGILEKSNPAFKIKLFLQACGIEEGGEHGNAAS